MKPSIGRVVIVVAPQASSNGTDRAPGLITRVWSDAQADTMDEPATINATVFPDLSIPQTASSVRLYDTEADALEQGEPGQPFAYWPPRT